MAECFIVRRGGKARLKSISVKTPPAKLEYLAGDTFDPTGLVLTALIGGVEVDVTTGYTITPETLAADTTAVTISCTLDGKTATTTQAVTVKTYNAVLENNSWEMIAAACEEGLASSLWQVGDQKTFEINGTSYVAKIVDFDHYSLATTDAKYGTSYNGGTNKNALTFLVFTKMGNAKIDSMATSPGAWSKSTMYSNVMPQKLALLPEDLQAAIRKVSIYSLKEGLSDNSLFIPAVIEIKGTSNANQTEFSYYTAGNSFGLTDGCWSRDISSGTTWKTMYESSSGTGACNASNAYHVIFCL